MDSDDGNRVRMPPEVYALLLLSGHFTDEEVLLLLICEELDFMDLPPEHAKYKRFDLTRYSDEECKHFFRFGRNDIEAMVHMLGLHDRHTSKSRVLWSGEEGLCVLLRRLAYPNRLGDLVPMFGRSIQELSYIFNGTLYFLFAQHAHCLDSVTQPWCDHERFAEAVYGTGASLSHIWGFIDGTIRKVCRPTQGQRALFSGHKRYHGVKYQHVMAPNGIIVHCFRPFEGRRHDSAMLRESNLLALIAGITDRTGRQLALYGDGGYPLRPCLLSPYRGPQTAQQTAFNMQMSKARISVEWGFGKVVTLFAFINFYANQKFFLQPVGPYFTVATLLTNCHTCLYGSEIADLFGLKPPTLEEYLA